MLADAPLSREDVRSVSEAETRNRARRGASAYCVIAAVLVLGTAPLDRVRFGGGVASTVLVVRLAGATALAIVAALLQTRIGRRHPRALAVLAPCVTSAVLQALVFFTGGDASPINISTIFAILGVAVLIPWPPAWTAIACAAMIGGYGVRALTAQHAALGWTFVWDLVVFTAASALAVLMSAVRQRQRASESAHGWALAAANRETRESGKRYRSLVETAGSAIIVLDAVGAVTEFNREAERVLGWRREDAIERDFVTLCVREDGRAGIRADIARSLAGQPTRGREVRMITRDGTERVVVCNSSRLEDDGGAAAGVIVCAQDISGRKRIEEALRESEARLRTVISSAPVVMFTVDAGGTITFSDGSGLSRFGLAPGEIVGQKLADVYPHRAEAFARALTGEAVSWSGTLDDAVFECRLTPLHDADGAVTGVIGLVMDVTERKQAEETRLALERTVLETQKLESLRVLAGGVAHDFNNLLVSVLGNASLLLSDLPPGARARETVLRIESAARRGSDLARQMLAYAGKGRLMNEPVDVNAVVAEMTDLLRVSMPSTLAVETDLTPELPAVDGDPTQVQQVVMNLVINASEAIGGAGGLIRIRTAAIDVDDATLQEMQRAPESAAGPHVLVEVSDTGCGMDPPTAAKIFDPFFSTKFMGRGLGLATVHGIIRAHRGALGVRSEPGHGTTFTILLPETQTASPARTVEVRPAVPAPAEPDRRTVLLVDDEEDVRAVTAHMLERLGCTVLVAADGREGVEVFRAHAQVIDATILDLTLPRMSGDNAFREIVRIRPDARVILMSGYNDENATGRLAAEGLAGFLRKPFSVSDLRSTMHRALGATRLAG